ncbi:MAG: helical backbone metal receptor [Myxococcota bacterium]
MGEAVVDALGRHLGLPRTPTRVVSLVPSETETIACLLGAQVVVGRTRYCEHAPDAVVVGGTKDPDVEAVCALAPDLVLANKEESGRKATEALMAAGLTVHVSFPTTAFESVAYVERLARLVGVPDHPLPPQLRRVVGAAAADARAGVPVFVPIWKEPWMSFDGRTFASDMLELAGGQNVVADRPRRYPLAADLGRRPALDASRVGDRDTRYPRLTLAEVRDREPALVLLPDEPYDFDEDDEETLRGALAGVPTARVSGKHLFWYGAHVSKAIPALRHAIAAGVPSRRRERHET